jgi:uncharacterized protein (UPF0332 family)
MGNGEAEWRSAASRAYYAAFHAARIMLRSCGFTAPHGDQVHTYVWMRLANCGHIDLQRAGNRLNELRGMRNLADYDLDHPFVPFDALDQVRDALDILLLLETACTLPVTLARITDAIRVYERDVLGHVSWRP